MPRELSTSELQALPRPGQTIFVGGALSEPAAILDAWRQAQSLTDVTLIGLQIPGINRVRPDEFGHGCRYRTAFLTPELRSGVASGAVELLPMHYSDFHRHLREEAAIDLAVFQVSPPDAEGWCSLGPCADHVPALLARDGLTLVAQINPELPPARDGVRMPLERLWGVHRAARPLPELPIEPDNATARSIAQAVASLVADGDCVQVGIGRLADAVLALLADRRGLTLHAGLLGAAGLELLERGSATRVVAGAAIGTLEFYHRAAAAEVEFRPVAVTHDAAVLQRYPRLVAINSAVEVDLFGQVNCEFAGSRLVSAFGGINDFMRPAHCSPAGRAVVALPARAGRSATSRIVARLSAPALVSVHRADVDFVVTEFGVADLRGQDLRRRARALIQVAAPEFRSMLSAEWDRFCATL